VIVGANPYENVNWHTHPHGPSLDVRPSLEIQGAPYNSIALCGMVYVRDGQLGGLKVEWLVEDQEPVSASLMRENGEPHRYQLKP